MNRTLAAALLLLAAAGCRAPAPATGPREATIMEWKGQFCGVAQGSHRTLTTAADWEKTWAEIGQAAPPAPDFKTLFAVAVFLGQRSTGGYGVRWLEPVSAPAATTVRYQVVSPRGLAIQVLSQPFAVKIFPRAPGKVLVAAEPG